jgi:hypothetical protein
MFEFSWHRGLLNLGLIVISFLVSPPALCFVNFSLEGASAFYGSSSTTVPTTSSTTASTVNSNTDTAYRGVLEVSLNHDRDFSLEILYETHQFYINLPSGVTGVSPNVNSAESAGLFNFYLSRWIVGFGGGYLSHPIYNLQSVSSVF